MFWPSSFTFRRGGLPATALVCCSALWLSCAQLQAREVSASQQLYLRSDTDHTTVVSPRTELAADAADDVRLQAAYTMDAWTGASIDVRTAATEAIVEQRHELNLQGTYTLFDWAFSGSYRYSLEPDYTSHGGVLSATADLAQHNTTLVASAFFGHDRVGRASDPLFEESLSSIGARLSLTQVLDEELLAQVSYEAALLRGFQESVYRFVALGGDGTCAGLAPYCLPEQLPEQRLRHAATATVRRALGSMFSLSLRYRLYLDSFGVVSHTLSPQLAATVLPALTLRLDYRLYTQGAADFYRARYFAADGVDGYLTRDRKLSPLVTHGAAFSAELHTSQGALGDPVWAGGLRAGITRFHYRAFVGLQHVYALELSSFVGLEFE